MIKRNYYRDYFAHSRLDDKISDYSGKATNVFTRASAATYADAGGVIQTAASGEARFTGGLSGPGYHSEHTATNFCTESFDLTSWGLANASVSANVFVAPNGTTEACTATDSSTGLAGYILSATTLSGAGSRAVRFWVRQDLSAVHFCAMTVFQVGASGLAYIKINQVNGAVNVDTITGGVSVSAATTTEITLINGDVWYNCSCIVSTTDAPTGHSLLFYPAFGSVASYPAVNSAAVGTTALWGVTIEPVTAISASSSYIETTGSTVTRASDELKTTTGTAQTDIMWSAQITPDQDYADYTAGYVVPMWSSDSRGTANQVGIDIGATAFAPTTGGGVFSLPSSYINKGVQIDVAVALIQEGANSRAIVYVDGVELLNVTQAQTLDHSNLFIAHMWSPVTLFHFNGNIKDIRVLTSGITAQLMRSITFSAFISTFGLFFDQVQNSMYLGAGII